MGTQDDDLRDRPEPGQATPRTTAQDAGGNEGGSLSAARLLRSLGKFVGLGSDVPSPVPSDPARLDKYRTMVVFVVRTSVVGV